VYKGCAPFALFNIIAITYQKIKNYTTSTAMKYGDVLLQTFNEAF
jgi:hypothetical protein